MCNHPAHNYCSKTFLSTPIGRRFSFEFGDEPAQPDFDLSGYEESIRGRRLARVLAPTNTLVVACPDSKYKPDELFKPQPGEMMGKTDFGGMVPNEEEIARVANAILFQGFQHIRLATVLTHYHCARIQLQAASCSSKDGVGYSRISLEYALAHTDLPMSTRQAYGAMFHSANTTMKLLGIEAIRDRYNSGELNVVPLCLVSDPCAEDLNGVRIVNEDRLAALKNDRFAIPQNQDELNGFSLNYAGENRAAALMEQCDVARRTYVEALLRGNPNLELSV